MGREVAPAVLLAVLAFTACSGSSSPSSPTSSSASVQTTSARALINSTSMSSNTSVAVAGATVVHFDVTGSTGQSQVMDFGDGTSSSTSSGCIPGNCQYFEHVYATAGAYSATLKVTDAQGGQATAQASVTVKDMKGTWTNTVLNPSNGRTETRTLTLSGGASLTGTYTHPEGNTESLTGSVDQYGSVHVKLDSGTISWDGVDLDGNGVHS
ncbi:MAG: PKD domain-containing protein, partial [Acidobacteriota bacterium]|nr:PKD domain-containing protein [Acidobacteriota bacterium]